MTTTNDENKTADTKVVHGLPPSWSTQDVANYRPEMIETPAVVLAHDVTKVDNGWADPEDFRTIDFRLRHSFAFEKSEYVGTIFVDEAGRPINPAGPTGKAGRILGRWGPNLAADPIVLARQASGVGDDVPRLKMLAIERKDTGAWAIPGGMVDAGEDAATTAARELLEECGVAIDFGAAHVVFQGVVDSDPRNTDHAWMETVALAVLLSDDDAKKVQPRAGDDARDAKWMLLDDDALDNFYANHGTFVRAAVAWATKRTS